MKRIQIVIACCLFSYSIFGQSIDHERMQKDLEVSEKILETVIQHNESPVVFMGRDKGIVGSYIEDYGVVFNISTSGVGYAIGVSNESGKNDLVIVDKRKEVIKGGEAIEFRDELIESIKEFLAEYGSLIHQLNADDRISVRSSMANLKDRSYAWLKDNVTSKMPGSSFSVEVKVSDLNAYEAGSIGGDELHERIVVFKSEDDLSDEPQLEVFSSMLDRLYQSDLSDTYYMANAPYYDRMQGFGATYYLKFYSSRIYDNNMYSLPTIGKKDLSEKERNQIVEEMYPKFLEGLKQNIIEYGHVLKNLSRDDILVLQVELTSCRDCDMPEEIELSIKKAVIDDYRLGKIELAEALDELNVRAF